MKYGRVIHEECGISHEMGDIGVALAGCNVARDVESQQASETTDE
jgi:hypothetical protein